MIRSQNHQAAAADSPFCRWQWSQMARATCRGFSDGKGSGSHRANGRPASAGVSDTSALTNDYYDGI